jgi:hypothetical protein
MTNCPDRSTTVRSWTSPLRNNSKLAPGAAVPAITASPARPTSEMSKPGTIPSSLPGERGGTTIASAVGGAAEASSLSLDAGDATTGAVVAAPVSTGCSRHTRGMPKTRVATHPATSTREGTAIRPINVVVMVRNRWPNRRFVCTPKKTLPRYLSVIKSAYWSGLHDRAQTTLVD